MYKPERLRYIRYLYFLLHERGKVFHIFACRATLLVQYIEIAIEFFFFFILFQFDKNKAMYQNIPRLQESLILIQGICPNGWHLPSDQEWSELEKAIYSNIGKFSTSDKTDLAGWTIPGWDWSTQWDRSTDLRGDPVEDGHVGHAGAMKNACPPRGSAFALEREPH